MDLTLIQVLLTAMMTPQGMAIVLVALFITKRLVPYWQYDEVLNKLKRYEEQTPVLLIEFDKLKQLIDDKQHIESRKDDT